MISEHLLKQQLGFTLERTDLKIGQRIEGKVRDCYISKGKRIIVCTDRLSAFDVVLCTLPFKGQVLNQLSAFWFGKTKSIIPNHVIDVPDPNVTVARDCTPIPVEFIVRGYITGVTKTSLWYNYSNGSREYCGHRLPDGLRKDQKLNVPIVTPTTKAEKGLHDELVSRDSIIKRGILDGDEFDTIAEISLKLFELGSRLAARNGIILVDTKYEFGRDHEGEITLIDEIHTPDSSRFWFRETYQEIFKKGEEQMKIDKEYVRKWLAESGFTGDGAPPNIPDDVKVEGARRYIEAFECITGESFESKAGNVSSRIARNLEKGGYL
ncbi:phosphoribosylaminoimidazolesuccinocarboxamide synthase [Candidatus Woesearchaeota archaeon]|nr:phosphoribosylaminoimidazolesuccinocarboxamide synthase [Candidatus Woesearchaeota archaeon]